MPLFKLLRLPGVFTAIADVLSGYLLVRFFGAGDGDIRSVPFLLGASACLYTAGMVWNDVFDVEHDCIYRPERPIPSGQISLTAGFMIAVSLSLAGLMLAMTAGNNSFLLAFILLCAVIFYNGGAKHVTALGPLTMGSCRTMNMMLGMTAFNGIMIIFWNPLLFIPPLILGIYTAVITALSEQEALEITKPTIEDDLDSAMDTQIVRDDEPMTQTELTGTGNSEQAQAQPDSLIAIIASITLIFIPLATAWIMPGGMVGNMFFLILTGMLAFKIYPLFFHQSGKKIRSIVGSAITGMTLLNAGMVASLAETHPIEIWGTLWNLPGRVDMSGILLVAVMIIPATLLRRRVALT